MNDTNAGGGDPGEVWDFVQLIQAVVPAQQRLEAIGKGAIAFRDVIESPDIDGIDNYRLIYDFVDDVSEYLTDRWGTIPAVTRCDSATGQRLFQQARTRTTEATAGPPFLVTHTGEPYSFDTADADHPEESGQLTRWLVPAIAVRRTEPHSQPEALDVVLTCFLECSECRDETKHLFVGRGDEPTLRWMGQSIWKCDQCGFPRYGPEPV